MKKKHIALGLIVLGSASVFGFFLRHEYFSNYLIYEDGFYYEHANAAKHSFAAGNLYRGLRTFYVPAEAAEAVILQLGRVNEYAEQVFKVSSPDSTREIMKDLYNNQAGIMAAAQGHCLREGVIGMTKKGDLVLTPEHVPFVDSNDAEIPERSVGFAWEWFEAHRPAIRKRIEKALAAGAGHGGSKEQPLAR